MSENETPSMPKLTYSLGRLAVLLAMSENREEENLWKELITKQNYKCVATEVSGTLDDFLNNVIKNAVTAALRTNVIEQSVKDIHAINHAVLEAMNGVIPTSMAPNLNLKLKIAIVANTEWLAVGIYGVSAMYYITNQERCGLGVMHH